METDPHRHDHAHDHDGKGHDHESHDHKGHDHKAHGHHPPGHGHGGGHGHGHGHGGGHHHHGPVTHDRAFAIAASVNFAFVIAQIAFGFAANSMALIADAIHNLGDVLSLLLGWGAVWLSRRPPSVRRTYGWGRSSILAALANAVVLLISVGAIGLEAVQRLLHPEPVASGIVMIVAGVGILVNGGTALLFMRNRESDLNIRAQFLHLGGDAAISFAVVLAALAINLTGLQWIDPLASLGVAVVITIATWSLLRESMDLAMDAVPEQISHQAVRDWLTGLPGVTEVHDLHIWGLSTTETALTAHLVYEGEHSDRRLHDVATGLRQEFGIGHATLQIESDADAALCRLRPNDVV
ncbi:MAG: cation diffusion facilitator family transporter [Acetobacteraceae bacterium]